MIIVTMPVSSFFFFIF